MKRIVKHIACTCGSLEKILRQEMGLTRKQIRQAKFRTDGICLNRVRSRVTAPVRPGDEIAVLLEEAEEGSVHLEDAKDLEGLTILYEDEDLLIVNKKAGCVVHPSCGHYSDSLANQVVKYYRKQERQIRIRCVGRLDKDTSGAVVFAKNQAAAGRLAAQRKQGIFKKEYLALVQGAVHPEDGCIRKPLRKAKDHLMRMETAKDGLAAVTHYQLLQRWEMFDLLSLSIETGRTHQIRVHMASIDHPLLGDSLYGSGGDPGRTALHAWKIHLLQPFSKEEIAVTAPIPKDLKKFIAKTQITWDNRDSNRI